MSPSPCDDFSETGVFRLERPVLSLHLHHPATPARAIVPSAPLDGSGIVTPAGKFFSVFPEKSDAKSPRMPLTCCSTTRSNPPGSPVLNRLLNVPPPLRGIDAWLRAPPVTSKRPSNSHGAGPGPAAPNAVTEPVSSVPVASSVPSWSKSMPPVTVSVPGPSRFPF